MASYLSSPNLQSYQTTPVQPLNQQVMRTIGARTQYYINTASQIKSLYENAIHKNLTDETNQAELAEMTAKAQEEIAKITRTNLTEGDNVSKATKILEPISKNKNFIIDEHITNKIQSGFQKAQQALSTKGSTDYNQLSVQNLQDTLEDLRTARKNDPNNEEWYTKFTQDTLGTTYQPFDSKIEQARQKQIQDRVKNGKIKIDIPDGTGRIVTQEEVDMNSIQAQEWLRSTQPQQEIIQNQLSARVLSNRLRKASPEERQGLLASIKSTQQYNVEKEVSYIQAEKQKVEAAYALAPKEEQEKPEIKTQYQKAIDSYNDAIKSSQSQYKDFDDLAYFDPHKRNVAQNQLETVLTQRKIHGLIGGMGLDKTNRTYKSDTAFWERKRFEFNELKEANTQAYRQALLNQKALTAKEKADKEAGLGGSNVNPNATASADISDLGTSGMNDEDKKLEIGKQRLLTLQGEIESKKDDVAVQLFNKLGLMVNAESGPGVEDFYTALKAADENEQLSMILDNLAGGSETNKKLIAALMQEGVKKVNGNNGIFKESTIPKLTVRQSRVYLKAALENPEIFSSAVKKAGIDTGDFNTTDYLGYQKEQLDKDYNTEKSKYEKPLKEVAQSFGIPIERKSYDELKHYNKDQYIKDITPELKRKGYNQEEINQLTNYIKGENYSSVEIDRIDKLLADPQYSRQFDFLSARRQSLMNNPSRYAPYKERWENYEKAVYNKLAGISTGASNYNTVSYKVSPSNTPEDKTFDPNIDFNFTTFRQIVENNISSSDITGKSVDAETVTKVKQLVRQYPDVINGFSVYSDGEEQFIIPTINRTKESEKALNDVGLDPVDFTNTKIYLDKSTLKTLRVAPQSKDLNDFQHGKRFGANNFTIYNVGNGSNIVPAYDGSVSIPLIDRATGAFTVKQMPLVTFMQNNPEVASTIKAGQIDYTSAYLYSQEKDASRVKEVLTKHNIEVNEDKNLIWKDLPQPVKEELKRKTLTFKNMPL